MPESYVRPVTRAREPKPEWHAVWRFRAVAFVLLVVLGSGTAWFVNKLLHSADQEPGDIGPPAPTTAPAIPGG